jgi:hypothetical protein
VTHQATGAAGLRGLGRGKYTSVNKTHYFDRQQAITALYFKQPATEKPKTLATGNETPVMATRQREG